jgi:enamine deaminase RidA (YjgF/YER057c/UK114 family)
MMGRADDVLREMGIDLPRPPAPVANYVSSVRSGGLLFLAGHGPALAADGTSPTGKLGGGLSVDEGYEAARLVGINLLATAREALGDLDRVARVVKLLCMVNCTPDFEQQPAVANGCSDLLVRVFGERGLHARSAVGMSSLPFGIPVEIEMIVEVKD